MIRTLVVDDSKFMRTLIADTLVSDPKIDVIATAKDGEDAVAKARPHHPDVITLGVEMPDVITLGVEMSRMDELEALRAIMDENPTPVVMLSALTQKGADATLEALRHGAVDFVPKPSSSLSLDIGEVKDLLISRIKAAALAKPRTHPTPHLRRARTSFRRVMGKHIIVIGTSTGGPRPLSELLPQLPGDIPAGILIVQHMPPWFTNSLAERLDKSCAIRVKEVEAGNGIEDGAYMFSGIKGNTRNIGERNITAVKNKLKEKHIKIVGEDVGGNDRHALSREMR
jgi:two-component system chemotaxis response regulator CheB